MNNDGQRDRSPITERWPFLFLLGVLALALILRLGWPTLVEFKRDEATVMRRALAIAYEGDLPAVGVGSSMGTANLPLTLYLTAIPLRVWQDPLAAVLFTGLLNGLAVLGCYLLGRAYLGRRAALLASLLFAVGPWAVLYARKVWCRNLPLFTLVFVAFLLATFVRRRPWALVGVFAALAALVGLQLEGIAFIPLLLVVMILYRKEVALGPLVVGVLLFGLLLAPYAIQDARLGWPNLRSLGQYVGGEGRFSVDALRYAFMLTGSGGIHGMAGSLYPEYRAGLPNLWWLNGVMMGLLALALVYGLVQAVRGEGDRRRVFVLFLLWFAIPVGLQSRPTAPVYPHYFVQLYPVQFLLVAAMVVDVVERLARRAGRLPVVPVLLGAALLLWVGWQTAVTARLYTFMVQHPTTGGYGIPLRYTRAAALAARELAGAADVIVLSTETDPATAETPAVFDALLFGQPHRFADGRWALPVSQDPAGVHLVGPLAAGSSDLAVALAQLAAMEQTQAGAVIALPDGWSYRLFYREGEDREDVLAGLTRFPEESALANGVVLLASGLAENFEPGETLKVWLAWWVRSAPPHGVRYHFFTHLIDENGGLRGQHDGAAFPAEGWREGDLVVSRFAISVPADLAPGSYTVRAGLYTYPDVAGVPVLDVAGNPAGDSVVLGWVSVAR